jgi:hypothetical protein
MTIKNDDVNRPLSDKEKQPTVFVELKNMSLQDLSVRLEEMLLAGDDQLVNIVEALPCDKTKGLITKLQPGILGSAFNAITGKLPPYGQIQLLNILQAHKAELENPDLFP